MGCWLFWLQGIECKSLATVQGVKQILFTVLVLFILESEFKEGSLI